MVRFFLFGVVIIELAAHLVLGSVFLKGLNGLINYFDLMPGCLNTLSGQLTLLVFGLPNLSRRNRATSLRVKWKGGTDPLRLIVDLDGCWEGVGRSEANEDGFPDQIGEILRPVFLIGIRNTGFL